VKRFDELVASGDRHAAYMLALRWLLANDQTAAIAYGQMLADTEEFRRSDESLPGDVDSFLEQACELGRRILLNPERVRNFADFGRYMRNAAELLDDYASMRERRPDTEEAAEVKAAADRLRSSVSTMREAAVLVGLGLAA
jgi:hypothetical protein